LAALATTTLDIQYCLWQGDNSGLALTHEVLQAATAAWLSALSNELLWTDAR